MTAPALIDRDMTAPRGRPGALEDLTLDTTEIHQPASTPPVVVGGREAPRPNDTDDCEASDTRGHRLRYPQLLVQVTRLRMPEGSGRGSPAAPTCDLALSQEAVEALVRGSHFWDSWATRRRQQTDREIDAVVGLKDLSFDGETLHSNPLSAMASRHGCLRSSSWTSARRASSHVCSSASRAVGLRSTW